MNRGVMKMKDSQKRFHSRSVCLHSFFLLSLSLFYGSLSLSFSASRAQTKINIGRWQTKSRGILLPPLYIHKRLRWMRSAIFAWDHVCRKTCSQTTALLSASFRPFSRSSSLARVSFVDVQEIRSQHPFNKQ
jgi:hypothetical protein